LTRFFGLISEADTISCWRHPHPKYSRFPLDIRASLKEKTCKQGRAPCCPSWNIYAEAVKRMRSSEPSHMQAVVTRIYASLSMVSTHFLLHAVADEVVGVSRTISARRDVGKLVEREEQSPELSHDATQAANAGSAAVSQAKKSRDVMVFLMEEAKSSTTTLSTIALSPDSTQGTVERNQQSLYTRPDSAKVLRRELPLVQSAGMVVFVYVSAYLAATKPSVCGLDMPDELLLMTCTHLAGSDTPNLRLLYKRMHSISRPALGLVYFSERTIDVSFQDYQQLESLLLLLDIRERVVLDKQLSDRPPLSLVLPAGRVTLVPPFLIPMVRKVLARLQTP
ncbi:hypothetical protein E4T43_04166, partial [Aureobasidium subglaciale]